MEVTVGEERTSSARTAEAESRTVIATPPRTVISVASVSKSVAVAGETKGIFGRKRARKRILSDVSFDLTEGECVGLLGANGAGKTTLMRTICGLTTPTEGAVHVFGSRSTARRPDVLRRIGFMSAQRPLLWPEYRLSDSYALLRTLYDMPPEQYARRLRELTERFDLVNLLGQTQSSLSFGQRIKAEIVGAVLHDPSLVILDEPTTGLDVPSQKSLRGHLRALVRDAGKSVVLSSHTISDVAELCGRFIFLSDGKIALDIGLSELMRVYDQRRRLEITISATKDRADAMLLACRNITVDLLDANADAHSGLAVLTAVGSMDALAAIQSRVQEAYASAATRWGNLAVHDAIELLHMSRGEIS